MRRGDISNGDRVFLATLTDDYWVNSVDHAGPFVYAAAVAYCPDQLTGVH